MEEILKEIVDKRLITLNKKGIDFGINIPEKRSAPLSIPDFNKGILICEIKRGSPSEGKMNGINNSVEWVKKYVYESIDHNSI